MYGTLIISEWKIILCQMKSMKSNNTENFSFTIYTIVIKVNPRFFSFFRVMRMLSKYFKLNKK
jgi:hypothetical protein